MKLRYVIEAGPARGSLLEAELEGLGLDFDRTETPGEGGEEMPNQALASLGAPLLGMPRLAGILDRAVLDIERDLWADEMEEGDADGNDPWDRDEPCMNTGETLRTAPSIHQKLSDIDCMTDLPEYIQNEIDRFVEHMADRLQDALPPEETEAIRQAVRTRMAGPAQQGNNAGG